MGVCAVVIGGVDGVIGRAAVELGEVGKDAHGGGVCSPIAVPDVIHGGRAEHDWPAVIASAIGAPGSERACPRRGVTGRCGVGVGSRSKNTLWDLPLNWDKHQERSAQRIAPRLSK